MSLAALSLPPSQGGLGKRACVEPPNGFAIGGHHAKHFGLRRSADAVSDDLLSDVSPHRWKACSMNWAAFFLRWESQQRCRGEAQGDECAQPSHHPVPGQRTHCRLGRHAYQSAELCTQVQQFGGNSVLEASDNQPTLREASADLFEDRSPDRRRWMQAETWDKGHGRLE